MGSRWGRMGLRLVKTPLSMYGWRWGRYLRARLRC